MRGLLKLLRWYVVASTDILMPPRGYVKRTRAITIDSLKVAPTVHRLLDTTITTLLNYKDRNTHNVIQALKYDASRDAVHLCSTVLADFLAEEIATLRTFSDRSIMLVPIPLHPERTRTRGFNQIEKVLRGLPKEYRDGTMSSVQPLLVRTRDTPHQTHLPRNERLKNVDGAFALRKDISIKHAHIILIDDVTTTGATLTCAGTPFRRSGATITLLALARA